MKNDTHFEDRLYHSTLDDLEAIARTFDPAAPDDLRTRFTEALGNLGIWPVSCLNGSDKGSVEVVA